MRSGILVIIAATLLSIQASENYEVWVTNERSGDITVVDDGGSVIATFPVGKRPRGIHVSPDQKRFMSL